MERAKTIDPNGQLWKATKISKTEEPGLKTVCLGRRWRWGLGRELRVAEFCQALYLVVWLAMCLFQIT